MSAGPVRGLNKDVTAFKMDCSIFAALADGEFCALVHLHVGTITQADKSVTAIRSAEGFILGKLITGTDGLLAIGRNAIQPSVNRLDGGPRSGWRENPVALHEECDCTNRNNNHGSDGIHLPRQRIGCSRGLGRLPCKRSSGVLEVTAAAPTFVQVSFNQQCARNRQLLVLVVPEQGAHAGPSMNCSRSARAPR